MTEVASHKHGSFCFAELRTPDEDRARQYYGELFGWNAVALPHAADGYSLFRLADKDVSGLWRTDIGGSSGAGAGSWSAAAGPPRWIPYLSVESVDRAAVRAHELGATILAAPFDLPGLARVSLLRDPAGGVVGLREARGHDGARLVDQPGTMWWVELVTRDVTVAKTFYAGLLGWRAVDTLKYGIRYSVFKLGDDSLAGLLPIGADWGPVAARWQILFAVDDCDAVIARARALGGSVEFGPNDVPNAGRAAVLRDAGGAIFVVMRPNGPSQPEG